MRIDSRSHAAYCALHLSEAATRPNVAGGDGIWGEVEVRSGGIQATSGRLLFSRSELSNFIEQLEHFAAERAGEVALRNTKADPSHLREVLPLWYESEVDTPPSREATLRIFHRDRARHVALQVTMTFRDSLQSQPIDDVALVTFSLDPSSLLNYVHQLADDLAKV